jgi:excisionase family DNA binding protein
MSSKSGRAEHTMQYKESLEKLITPAELTQILGLKRSCVYRMLRSGLIPSICVSTGERKLSLRVRPSALEKWLKAREVSNAQR